MTEEKEQERVPSLIAIQRKLRKDLNAYKVVSIRASEIMQKDQDDRCIRRFIGNEVEVLDEDDVRPFLKIAANFMRRQMLAAKKGEEQ